MPVTMIEIARTDTHHVLFETDQPDNARFVIEDANGLVVGMTAYQQVAEVLLAEATDGGWQGEESTCRVGAEVRHVSILPRVAIAIGNAVIALVPEGKAVFS